jgi:hypothetical protein
LPNIAEQSCAGINPEGVGLRWLLGGNSQEA